MGDIHLGYRQHVSYCLSTSDQTFRRGSEANRDYRILHMLTALFHEVKDRKHNKDVEKDGTGIGNGTTNGNGGGNGYMSSPPGHY